VYLLFLFSFFIDKSQKTKNTKKKKFSIFFIGVYGDVHRVKILFNKKDSALIQFATPQQAAVGKYKLYY
jgi:hypothetical protein